MSLLTDVKALLTTVTNIYISDMPSTPDAAVCLYNTGGYARSLTGTKVEEPTFQVKVRNPVAATGLTTCATIKDILHGYTGGKFLMIAQQGDVQDLGRDENGRMEFTVNFRCYYRR